MAEEMTAVLNQLKEISARLDRIEGTMATKEELARLESKMATKEEVARVESRMGTKEELARLEKMTKEEIARLESKMAGDIASFQENMERRLDEIYAALQQVLGDAGELADRVERSVRSDLEPRIEQLERIHPQGQHAKI